MKKTGKSTLIRNLIDECNHNANTSPFQDTACEPTTEVKLIVKTLFINGKFYKCTFIDTPGLRTVPDNIQQSTDELTLIMFVLKHGNNSTEAISYFTNKLQDIACQSVAVIITFCDTLIDEEYKDIIKKFMSSCDTKQFSTDVYKRVYPIGFPNTALMEERAGEFSRNFIQKNVSKLHQLIEQSSDYAPARDVAERGNIRCSVM